MTNSGSNLESGEARHELYDIMLQDVGFEQKGSRALTLGREYLGVENAHLTRVDPAVDYWEATESTDPPNGSFPVGLTLDLDSTYCRRTIQQDAPIALHDAPNQGWEDDPAFKTHELHTYHGVCVTTHDEIYGTVCFVSESPRDDPFTDEESMFTELIARLLGHEIEHEHHELELTERKQMINVLCRVLRHDLRNGLNIIRGEVELMHGQSAASPDASVNTILSTVDGILAVSDRTRELSDLIDGSFLRRELDIEAIVRELAADIEDEYPDATVSLEGTADTKIRASTQVKTGLRELLENAAMYSETDPAITVSLTRTQQALQIQIADNGPGIPEQEQAVLESGVTTPLEHGSGLGLWVVHWIVTRHDGTIETAVSEPGTTVTLTLPLGPVKLLSEKEPSTNEVV